jgi:RNA polymerase sigma factor (TIGR02999 family)
VRLESKFLIRSVQAHASQHATIGRQQSLCQVTTFSAVLVMLPNMNTDVTTILMAIDTGDAKASERLLPLVYNELRQLAAGRIAREAPGQTLNPTALVHEAYLRLVDQSRPPQWSGRGHFFGAAAEAMRRILIERARRKRSFKGGGNQKRQELEDVAEDASNSNVDMLALDEALSRLEQLDKRKADVVKLRFFAGLTNQQAAEALGISASTADNDWAFARCWLKVEMDG